MTTPNQGPPDGAVRVGGGRWRFGQMVNERRARETFELDAPGNIGEALDMLPFVLNQLPSNALKPWLKWLNLPDDDIANGTIRQKIVDALSKHPLRRLIDNLFDGFKGTAGSDGKTPEDVASAAAELSAKTSTAQTNADMAVSNAQKANDLASEIISSGDNLVVNGDFERGLSTQPAQGVFSTDIPAFWGSKTLKMTGNGTTTKSYDLLFDGLTPRTISASEGTVFYIEAFVWGAASNTQAAGALGVRFSVTPKTRFGVDLADAYIALNVNSALNGVWTKVSGYVTMPANTAKVSFALQLTNAVNNGQTFYWDYVTVREVTLAKQADDKAVNAGAVATTANTNATNAGTIASTAQTTATNANTNATNAQTTANTANTTATTANSTANTANTNATTATNTANTANTTATTAQDIGLGIVTAGSNLIANPGFEQGVFSQGAGVYSTDVARTGSRSLKITCNGVARKYTFHSDDTILRTIPVDGGDVLDAEVYVYGHTSNTGSTGFAKLVFEPLTATGSAYAAIELSQPVTTALNGVWTKIAGQVTMPANAARVRVSIQTTSTVASGSILYFDDATVREITVAATADTKAQGTVDAIVQAVDGGSATGAVPTTAMGRLRLAWANMWDGLGGTSGATDKLPSDIRVRAGLLKTKADTTETVAGAATTNLQTTVNGIGQAIDGGTGTYAHTTVKDRLQLAWANLWDGLGGSSGATSKLPSDVRTRAGLLKSKADSTEVTTGANTTNLQVAVDGIGRAVDGGSATYAHTTVAEKLRLAWANIWDGLNGTAGSTSRLPSEVRDKAALVKSTSDTAFTNATGAQDTANTAVSAAALADSLAVYSGAANNVLLDPDFEDTSIRRGTYTPSGDVAGAFYVSYTTEQAQGGNSLKCIARNTTPGYPMSPLKADGTSVKFPVAPGMVFKFDVSVMAKATNVGTGNLQLNVSMYDAAGYTYGGGTVNVTSVAVTKGSWQRITATYTIPATIPGAGSEVPFAIVPSFSVASCDVGDIFYLDRVFLYR